MELPEQYLRNMREILTDRQYAAYLSCFGAPVANALRINTSKISVEDFLKISPFSLTPVEWCYDGFYYSGNDDPSHHPYYHAGLYYLQEASSMLPGEVLPIEKGNMVLDGCSAPGGKACKLANKLQNTGLLVSNDVSFSRQSATLRNLERFGIRNQLVISAGMEELAEYWPEIFDRILIDVPCSGEGMFRRNPSLIKDWLVKGPDYYAPIQKQIIEAACRMLKKGGMMVYSTCTFSPKEDEEVIEHLLDRHPDMEVIPIRKTKGMQDGLTERCRGCARLYPFEVKGEGHFTALLRKSGEEENTSPVTLHACIDNESFRVFMNDVSMDVSDYTVTMINENLHLIPAHELPLFKGRTLRSGLLLGSVHNGQFTPSQPLAMSLRKDDYTRFADHKSDDIRVMKYLKGETIEADSCEDGWTLVCVDSFPLGFAKAERGRLKNKIDRGWRII